jgi:hypothetical protein
MLHALVRHYWQSILCIISRNDIMAHKAFQCTTTAKINVTKILLSLKFLDKRCLNFLQSRHNYDSTTPATLRKLKSATSFTVFCGRLHANLRKLKLRHSLYSEKDYGVAYLVQKRTPRDEMLQQSKTVFIGLFIDDLSDA